MRNFDHDYVADVVRRLGRLKPDARPKWGKLAAPGMIQHLGDSVRFSMGRAGEVPNVSNWFTRTIVAPLILNGIVRIPKNIKAPELSKRSSYDDVESLHALLEEYLGLVQAGEFVPARQPVFGDIGIDGWAKLHLVHFEHHLRQFGV